MQNIRYSILLPAGGKVKNAQNHRQIDARGEAEGIKPVIYGILYYRRRWVYYFSSYLLRKVTFLSRPAGGKIYFPPRYEEKYFSSHREKSGNFVQLAKTKMPLIFPDMMKNIILNMGGK